MQNTLHTQFFWSFYNTKYILNLTQYILNILCSYSKAPFKFCQSENFVAGSNFYILLCFGWDSIYKSNLKIINF